MGQSNMSGRGALSALRPVERLPDRAITMLGNDGRVTIAHEPIDDVHGQVDAVSADPLAAVGPGLFFARALRRTDADILLVPCAKGGSAIIDWRPAADRTTLFGSCLARARQAAAPIAGMLWYQGESDTKDDTQATVWTAAFAELVAALRTGLNSPHLPVVMVRIGDKPMPRSGTTDAYPAWRALQRVQARLRLPCVATVDARGLPRNADGLHLSTEGQRRLGPRLAIAMRGLQRRCG